MAGEAAVRNPVGDGVERCTSALRGRTERFEGRRHVSDTVSQRHASGLTDDVSVVQGCGQLGAELSSVGNGFSVREQDSGLLGEKLQDRDAAAVVGPGPGLSKP